MGKVDQACTGMERTFPDRERTRITDAQSATHDFAATLPGAISAMHGVELYPPPGAALISFNCANTLLQSGRNQADFEKALNYYNRSAALCEPNVPVHVLGNRAGAYIKLGRFDEAMSDAERLVRVRPDHCLGYWRRATVLHEEARMGRREWSEAMNAYSQTLRIHPTLTLAKTGRETCSRERMAARREARERALAAGTTEAADAPRISLRLRVLGYHMLGTPVDEFETWIFAALHVDGKCLPDRVINRGELVERHSIGPFIRSDW